MEKTISRRVFLKGGAVLACAAAASGVPAAVKALDREPLATLYDLRKCIGCGSCVEACRDSNGSQYPKPVKPFPAMHPKRVKAEDWSEKQDVTDRLTPYNWLTVQQADVATDKGDITVFIPRRCMHCVNPPCVKLCPWGAVHQEKNGTAVINPDLCLGGAKCKNVCPWDIPQRQSGVGLYLDILPAYAGNGVMYKCNRCYKKVEKGENPACIDACPEGVQAIGPRNEIIRKAYEIAKETGGYVYGDKENGGTNTIYVSPVPFKELNRVIPKGKGQPDLAVKKDVMEDGNAMAKAIFLAPVAGVAGAFLRYITMAKKMGGASVPLKADQKLEGNHGD
jgi:Fe-S-cluster-containing dehydrogenase component